MSRLGIVIETSDGRAIVSTTRRGVCDGCSEKATCSFENALGKNKPEQVEVDNPVGAHPGDFVEFDLPGHTELWISLLVWFVPVSGLVAGAIAGAAVSPGLDFDRDLAAFLGGATGFLVTFAVVMLYDRKVARSSRLRPRIIKTVSPSVCEHLER